MTISNLVFIHIIGEGQPKTVVRLYCVGNTISEISSYAVLITLNITKTNPFGNLACL